MKAIEAARQFSAAIVAQPFVTVYNSPTLNVAHVAWGPGDNRIAVTFRDGVTDAELRRAMAEGVMPPS